MKYVCVLNKLFLPRVGGEREREKVMSEQEVRNYLVSDFYILLVSARGRKTGDKQQLGRQVERRGKEEKELP